MNTLTKQAERVLMQSPSRASVPREKEQAVVPAHYLQPGDVLLIEPVDFNADIRIPADQQVLADGSIDLGGFGRVVVAGLTLEMTEQLILRTIVDAGEKATEVNVRLLDPVDRYYVLGEVNSPGSYPLEGNETVLDGLLAAGGLTSTASPCKILLARPTLPSSCRITLPVCYREITQLGDTSTNYQLQPGDRIFVAARSWHEDLMFWEASKSCPRCGDCQAACVDPSVAGYLNPMTPMTATDSSVIQPIDWPMTNLESLMQPTSQRDSATDSIPAPSSPNQAETESSPIPARLPEASDGQLDFSSSNQGDRFEPLWIQSSAQAGAALPSSP